MIKDNEQWKGDGDCLKCRRLKYCGKPCKAHKQRKMAILQQMTARANKRQEGK